MSVSLCRQPVFSARRKSPCRLELVEERLAKGTASGYYFVLVDQEDRLAGYSCYGPIPGTVSSSDLYWIAVHPDFQIKDWAG